MFICMYDHRGLNQDCNTISETLESLKPAAPQIAVTLCIDITMLPKYTHT